MLTIVCFVQVVGVAALACGLISIAACNGEVTSVILQTMMERSPAELKDSSAHFLALGLGLSFLGNYQIIIHSRHESIRTVSNLVANALRENLVYNFQKQF